MKVTKTQLINTYVKNDLSMKDVADLFEVGVGSIHRAIKNFGIEPKKNRWRDPWNKGKTYKNDGRILAKENHPRYIDGREYPSDYKRIKNLAKKQECIGCDNPAEFYHHIDKNKHNNDISNLIPMCFSCHTSYHNRERKLFKDRKDFVWTKEKSSKA